MASILREILRKVLHTLEMPIDAVKRGFKRKFHLFAPAQILPYRGFANRRRAEVAGRVQEHKSLGEAKPDDPWWRNAQAMVRRFNTDQIPEIRVRGVFQGQVHQAITDSEGYFNLIFDLHEPPADDELWQRVELELLDRVTPEDQTSATGQILVPPEDAEFGVISDIDDTIVQSSATQLWRLVWLSLVKNAHTRTPFPYVARFYQALQQGARGAGSNPIFYVSSSVWNIYDLLSHFMQLNEIPQGPIFLRHLGLDSAKLIKSDHQHKLEKVENILSYYPRMPFILVGDSGQRDPWLYREAVRRHSGRIIAIYIRDVRRSRREAVREIADELRTEGIDMLLVEDAREAARHAYANGLISSESLT